jgi:polysaccharide biosynthesis protein PslH
METTMRILFLSAWCPLPADNGSKLRIIQILRMLARQHQIDLLAFAPDLPDIDAVQELQTLCETVELLPETPFAGHTSGRFLGLLSPRPRSMVANHSQAMEAAVRRRAGQHYDLVIAYELHMAPYALLFHGAPRLLEDIKLEIIRGQYVAQSSLPWRVRYGLSWSKTCRFVRWLLQHFSAATVVSEQEYALVQSLAPSHMPLAVISNGVDIAAYTGDFGAPDTDTLIYPGALSYSANFDAVAYFASSVLPHIRAQRSNTHLYVTGRVTPEQIARLPITEGVEFTGYLQDIRPAVAGAWAEVVPLRVGDGTRLKVLEALALGTPVISTTKGIEGLDLQPERDVLLANTADEFVAQSLRLLRSPTLRQEMVDHGRRAAVHYDWHSSMQLLEHMVLDVV